jgi:hypothetical protein
MFHLELRRKMLVSVVVGIICGSSLLVLPVHVTDLWGKPVAARIPDPLPLPCGRQNWTNADRICLSWTAPRDSNMSQTIAFATNRDRNHGATISTMQ